MQTLLYCSFEVVPSPPRIKLYERSLAFMPNVRPSKYFEGSKALFPTTDLVVVRENTEGMYTGEEHWEGEAGQSAVTTRRITREGTLRVARFAFDFATKHGRKKVTVS